MPTFRPSNPTGPYPIKGLPLEDGGVAGIRKELREFKEDADMWNLYLLGLWQFQLVPWKDQLSYFQIAGIHGLPYQPWPLDDPELQEPKNPNSGFCTHTSILFLTWHRPYLALFESVLQQAMLFVAEHYTEEEGKKRYLTAAKAFRMPFWDWALPDVPVFPNEATESHVRVFMPEALRKDPKVDLKKDADGSAEIPNPLFAYKFQEGVDEIFKAIYKERFEVEALKTTTRYQLVGDLTAPTPEDQKQAILASLTPYSREVNKKLPAEGNLRERVVYLLKCYKIFDQVSHNQWDPKRVANHRSKDPKIGGLGFGSIEDIHNTVHGIVGGSGEDGLKRKINGHMSNIPISAFDPIFWLHHTNIDRLVSIWEALHANSSETSWVTTKESYQGSWVTRKGTDEGLKTPLAPFYKDKGHFWTSDDVRDSRTFGYAYPETKSWSFADTKERRKEIERKLYKLYPSASLAAMIIASKAGDEKPEGILRGRAERLALLHAVAKPPPQVTESLTAVPKPPTALTALSLAQAVSETTESPLAAVLPPLDVPNVQIPDGRSLANLAKGNTYLEWLVNIKAVKHALGGQYLVHVFLGRVPAEEPTVLYSVSPYHVGTFNPLGASEDTACGKCQQDQAAGTEITGQIPLTIALAERYFAGALDSLEEGDVITYLKKHLHWEVVDDQGQRCRGERNLVEGLIVGVVSNEVKLPDDTHEFARYSPEITIYPEITSKKDNPEEGRAEGTGLIEKHLYFI